MTQIKTKKIIFLGHNGGDQEAVNIIELLIMCYLKKLKLTGSYEIKYSSSKIANNQFPTNSDIGINSIKYAGQSKIYIAYISENFNNSAICNAELGTAYFKHLGNEKDFLFLPLKDELLDLNNIGYVLKNKVVLMKFDDLINKLDTYFKTTLQPKQLSAIKHNFNQINNSVKNDVLLSKNDIKKYVLKTFNKNHPLEEFSFAQYIDRNIYNELHIELAELADEHLLWTAYKSPLNIKKSELDKNHLTKWDITFKNAKSRNRKRLIIFDTKSEKTKFFKDTALNKEELLRKKAFLASNNSFLYFSLKDDLISHYNSLNPLRKIDVSKYKGLKNEELYFEFAHLASVSNQFEFLVFSDFDNKSSITNRITQPLYFIKPYENEFKYADKVYDSLQLNNMVAKSFDDLVKNKKIIKI